MLFSPSAPFAPRIRYRRMVTRGVPARLTNAYAPAKTEFLNEEASRWQAKVFDNHQFKTVVALAELIIPKTDTPGAREASVHQHLDHILADSTEAERSKFLEGLWWLDGHCLRSAAKPFKDLAPDQQMQVAVALCDTSDPDLQPGRLFMQEMKAWTAKICYSTEIGQKELNKDGRVPSSYAMACQ
jgi:hypothetical protein